MVKAQYLAQGNTEYQQSTAVRLTFGKNVVTWGQGNALYIKGKGYKFLKVLYGASNMRLKESTLDRLVWNNNVSHHNFKEFVRRLAEKLKKTAFPYRLTFVMSKSKIEQTTEIHNNKPALRFFPPEIIGVQLHNTINSEKMACVR